MTSNLSRVLLAIALLVFTAGARLSIPRAPEAQMGEEFVPRPELARVAALGFDAAVADYYWLRAVQVMGGSVNPMEHATFFGRVIDVVTTLDPWVGHPYRFAAVWMIDSPENVRKANALLERAVAHHPDDWRNYFYLGFNHYFYLGDRVAGAEWFERALEKPGAPPYLGRLAVRLRAGNGDLDVAAGLLTQMRDEAPDGYTRAEYAKALDEVETERRARFLDAAREEYRRRHGRDIEKVADLVAGPEPVLRELPAELHGWEWVIGESGRIVSSWYGHRYELHVHEQDRERRKRWGVAPLDAREGS